MQKWKSVEDECNRPNRALAFYSIYIKRVLDANCLYKKLKVRRVLAVSLGLLNFVYLFSILGPANPEIVFSVAI